MTKKYRKHQNKYILKEIMDLERFRHKFEPSSAPSLFKLEKQFRQWLKKGQDPDIWFAELEHFE
jgi:hypothetical protein